MPSAPSISLTVRLHWNSILSLANALSAMQRGGAQLVAPVDDVDPRREPREEHGLLDGGVAAADDGDRLVPVQGAVAHGAPRDPAARVLGLARDVELARDGARREDDRLGAHGFAVDGDDEVLAARLDALDDREGADLGAERLGLLLHELAQLGAGHPLGLAGVVLDPVGRDDLTPGKPGLEDDRPGPGARRVQAGGQPRRAGRR